MSVQRTPNSPTTRVAHQRCACAAARPNQAANNYIYDANGSLVENVTDSIRLSWNVQKKVDSVRFTNGNPTIYYTYDAQGNRLSKRVNPNFANYYIRDAQGNALATYALKKDSLFLIEQNIYGSSRLGMKKRAILTQIDSQKLRIADTLRIFEEFVGAKNYELSNHLGNVLATISDKTIFNTDHYNSIVYSAQLYYPFGWEIPTLSFAAKKYRFGFNGVEKSLEIGEGMNTTFYREQDTRAARWWSLDPRPNIAVSPYAMMENNPIAFSDVLGDTIKGNLEAYDALKAYVGKSITNAQKRHLKAKNEKKKNEIGAYIVAMQQVQNEFDVLERSATTYRIIMDWEGIPSTAGGAIKYNSQEEEVIVAAYTSITHKNGNYEIQTPYHYYGALGHELKHAYQYAILELDFEGENQNQYWNSGVAYDIYDEKEAYDRADLIEYGIITNHLVTDIAKKKAYNGIKERLSPTPVPYRQQLYMNGFRDVTPSNKRYSAWRNDYNQGKKDKEKRKVNQETLDALKKHVPGKAY